MTCGLMFCIAILMILVAAEVSTPDKDEDE